MRNRANDDRLIERLLAGDAPVEHADLVTVSRALVELRSAAQAPAPQPTAALRARLDAPAGAGVSTAAGDAAAEPTTGRKTVFEWIAGLGLAAKIAAGSGVLALGLTGVGAAGALPGPAQDAFDSVVETVVPLEEEPIVEEEPIDDGTDNPDESTDDELPVGSDEFSKWVSENAQDPDKVGREFGEQVSEQARELRNEKAAERAANSDDVTEGDVDGESEGDTEGDLEGEGDGDETPETLEPAQKGASGNAGNRGGGRP